MELKQLNQTKKNKKKINKHIISLHAPTQPHPHQTYQHTISEVETKYQSYAPNLPTHYFRSRTQIPIIGL